MRKYLKLFLFLTLGIFACSAEQPASKDSTNKILLPFSNEKGVPFLFAEDLGENVVGSFIVDSAQNMFVIGGEPATLVKYTQQGKELFRHKYTEFQARQIYSEGDKIYTFDSDKGKNVLYTLNADNGQIEKKTEKLSENEVNSYCFADGKLILHVFGFGTKKDVGSKLCFSVFNLTGKYFGAAENPYNISSLNYPEKYQKASMVYLGKYKEAYLFNYWDVDNNKYTLLLVASNGKVLTQGDIPQSTFGKMLYGGIGEFWSLHGELISVLGKNNKQAMITTVSIDNYLNK
jgi:hypothetical protein